MMTYLTQIFNISEIELKLNCLSKTGISSICCYPMWEIIGMYHIMFDPDTEFRIGVFWGKIIYRKVEFPQT